VKVQAEINNLDPWCFVSHCDAVALSKARADCIVYKNHSQSLCLNVFFEKEKKKRSLNKILLDIRKKFFTELLSTGPGCPGQWWSPHPWRCSKTV